MSYKHILAAIDLSPNSKPVIKQARRFSAQTQATLDLVHVIEHSPVSYGGEFTIPVDVNLEHTIETQARESLDAFGKEFQISPDRLHTYNGSVKQAVIELAEKLHIDLIIIGTHGHHGLDRLLGSRANAILHGAQCDVLAVRTG